MGTTQSSIARSESGLVQPSLSFIERFVSETGQPLQLGSLMILRVSAPEEKVTGSRAPLTATRSTRG